MGGIVAQKQTINFNRLHCMLTSFDIYSCCYAFFSSIKSLPKQCTPKYSQLFRFHFVTIRGFNKHRQPTKHVGYFADRSRLLFCSRKKELVWITLPTKNIIIVKPEWKRNYDVFSLRPTGFTLCFSRVNTTFRSIFTGFFIGLRRIC